MLKQRKTFPQSLEPWIWRSKLPNLLLMRLSYNVQFKSEWLSVCEKHALHLTGYMYFQSREMQIQLVSVLAILVSRYLTLLICVQGPLFSKRASFQSFHSLLCCLQSYLDCCRKYFFAFPSMKLQHAVTVYNKQAGMTAS